MAAVSLASKKKKSLTLFKWYWERKDATHQASKTLQGAEVLQSEATPRYATDLGPERTRG